MERLKGGCSPAWFFLQFIPPWPIQEIDCGVVLHPASCRWNSPKKSAVVAVKFEICHSFHFERGRPIHICSSEGLENGGEDEREWIGFNCIYLTVITLWQCIPSASKPSRPIKTYPNAQLIECINEIKYRTIYVTPTPSSLYPPTQCSLSPDYKLSKLVPC